MPWWEVVAGDQSRMVQTFVEACDRAVLHWRNPYRHLVREKWSHDSTPWIDPNVDSHWEVGSDVEARLRDVVVVVVVVVAAAEWAVSREPSLLQPYPPPTTMVWNPRFGPVDVVGSCFRWKAMEQHIADGSEESACPTQLQLLPMKRGNWEVVFEENHWFVPLIPVMDRREETYC